MNFTLLFLTVLSIFQQVASLTILRTNSASGPIVAAWYAAWHATKGNPFEDVSWDKYTVLIYSSAITTPDASSLSLDDPSLLSDFVLKAHENGVTAHASVGSWGGSRFFSSNVATAQNRTAFVQAIADFASKYDLDGINFDWEYPNHQGIGCNTININDTQNFLLFLQELRVRVGTKLVLSAVVPLTPFRDASGNPSKDMSGFAKVLDFVALMNYDIYGPWSSTVGPNSPLNDTCAAPANQQGSAVSGVKAWTDAGFPVNQLVLAVASYSHTFRVSPTDAFVGGSTTELAVYPKFDASNPPLGDSWDDTPSVDVCGVSSPQGGTFRFWSLIEDKFLTTDGNPAPGIDYLYDECSKTPYVYNATSEVMVSYEDTRSFAAKGEFVVNTGLAGVAMWEAAGDYKDELLDSIRYAMGLRSIASENTVPVISTLGF